MAVIENVTFLYVKIKNPGPKYQEPNKKEFAVDCVVSKAEARNWNKKFPKQKAKDFENADFTEKFGIEVPFPDQEEQYVIKVKRDAQYQDGNPIGADVRPRVLQKAITGKLVDVTNKFLVGNGSKGAVQYTEKTNDFGTFAHLKAIRVDDLVVYESANDFSELGDVEESTDELATPAPSTTAPAKAETPTTPAKVEDKPKPQKAKAASKIEAKASDEDGPF